MLRRFATTIGLLATLFMALGGIGLTAAPVYAQVTGVDSGLSQVGDTVVTASTVDPRTIIVRIINIALGFLGIILLVIVLYAGYLYMTSGGNAEQISKAKALLRNAVIGLLIILSAWAITRFVLSSLLDASNGGGGDTGTQGPGTGGLGGSSAGFRINRFSTEGDQEIQNLEPAIEFSKPVLGTDANLALIKLIEKTGAITVPVDATVEGDTVRLTPKTDCLPPNPEGKKCLKALTDYTIIVAGSFKPATGSSTLSCTPTHPCTVDFKSGNVVDIQAPVVRLSWPPEGHSLRENYVEELDADVTDDHGVKMTTFFDGKDSVGGQVAAGKPSPKSFTSRFDWRTTGVALGAHTLSVLARDIDTNQATSADVKVVMRAEHCFNRLKDASETDIDCGGNPQALDYCGACNGGSCTTNADCRGGSCLAGVCVAKPTIRAISPGKGKPGTFVTILGANFGDEPGTVKFLGNPAIATDDLVAVAPQACVGIDTWGDAHAVVELPAGAAAGPVEITNGQSALSDRTDDINGPTLPDFSPDSTVYPGICGAKPDRDVVGQSIDIVGTGLGNVTGKILFGEDYLVTPTGWTDTSARFRVPVLDNGPYEIAAQIGTINSNAVAFDILDNTTAQPPHLDEIAPSKGPHQQIITLYGKNFGEDIGTVEFTSALNKDDVANGDVTFPAECSAGYWRNDRVTVKVPSTFKNGKTVTPAGKYNVRVVRRGQEATNVLEFEITTGNPGPGVCAIEPAIGPANTPVTLFGERFGTVKPTVTFAKGALSAITDTGFTDGRVDTRVPADAITGRVLLITAAKQDANTVAFLVRNCNEDVSICGSPVSDQCCPDGTCRDIGYVCGSTAKTAEYGWNASTGIIPSSPHVVEECDPEAARPPIPSPSPWDKRLGGDKAPVNSSIKIRFDTNIGDLPTGSPAGARPTSLSGAFLFEECMDSGSDPCKTTAPVDVRLDFTGGDTQDVVTLTPTGAGGLKPNTTYSIKVLSTVKAAGPGGGQMEVMASCGKGAAGETYGYCFRFKTRPSTDPARVGSVSVFPDPFHMSNVGDVKGYEAAPFAEDDRCVILNCDNYNWDWSTGDARASVTTNALEGRQLCRQEVTGNQETVEVPVDIRSTVKQDAVPDITGHADLFVNFIPPTVEEYAPNCEESCSNAKIWVRFSGDMDPGVTANDRNLVVQKCANENCDEVGLAPTPLALSNVLLTQVPEMTGDLRARYLSFDHPVLEAGAYYRVLLKAGNTASSGIKGTNGVPLDKLNHPEGFIWKFRVKQGADAFCKPDRVEVTPLQKFEYQVMASQLFLMSPYSGPNACAASGQVLMQDQSTTWATSKPLVARYYLDAAKDTGAARGIGCTSNCLASGASGQFGKLAICGNGTIETTDAEFCKVRAPATTPTTPNGKPCTVLRAGAKGGEQCEPSLDGALCEPSSCLYKPMKSLSAGGTCGNNLLNPGEMCDMGTFCQYAATVPLSAQTVVAGKACTDASLTAACVAAGGKCEPMAIRGCTAGCLHAGTFAGNSTCGNGDRLGNGKDCDDGNRTSGDGCSSSCLHEGSKSTTVVAAICGNGILEPGEVCEASLVGGALKMPKGCDSSSCLHTGSLGCNQASALGCCGNGVLERGEDCDDQNNKSGDGCSNACLSEGSSAGYRALNDPLALSPSFCSDSAIGLGEQCDAGVPSSYVAGSVDKGLNYEALNRAAEATTANVVALRTTSQNALNALISPSGWIPQGDGHVDPVQLAYIVGQDVIDADKRMSSTLRATYSSQSGEATYGLQCGFNAESQCQSGFGLDKDGCCRPRPTVSGQPVAGATNVCRNTLVRGTFNVGMDAGSVMPNFQVLRAPLTTTHDCPAGTTDVLMAKVYGKGLMARLQHAWDSLVQWLTAQPALADKWCDGSVTGKLQARTITDTAGNLAPPVQFNLRLDRALDANTRYRVIFKHDPSLTDNASVQNRLGVKTSFGVVTSNDLTWDFTTGAEICHINTVTVSDITDEHLLPVEQRHPYLYLNQFLNAAGVMQRGPETRRFGADAQAVRNGISETLVQTPEYNWNWNAWTENSSGKILNFVPEVPPTPAPTTPVTDDGSVASFKTADRTAGTKTLNGDVILGASVLITADTLSKPTTVDESVNGITDVMVMTCDKPWPSLSKAPFRDKQDSTNFIVGDEVFGNQAAATAFLGEPGRFFNFSLTYCRDGEGVPTTDAAGKTVATDLPTLKINAVPPNRIDSASGILRQYLLTYTDNAFKQDGIGIRILENPAHLSPEEWYRTHGFNGSPRSVVVDGYPAVQDGNSIYVAGSNRPAGTTGNIYSNVYLISHNEGATETTRKIFDQMVTFLSLNINMTGQTNVCQQPTGSAVPPVAWIPYRDDKGATVACSADWECLKYASNLKCDSLKDKLQRDTVRLGDFQKMAKTIEASKTTTAQNPTGAYPRIEGGTYLRNLTTSMWSSWKGELGQSISLASMPIDPINRLMACGRCSATSVPCGSTVDCDATNKDDVCQGGTYVSGAWTPDDKIDPASCWNSASRQFICPKLNSTNPSSVSRLYQYRAIQGGQLYELSSEFEVPPPLSGGSPDLANWWSPPLPTGVKVCSTPDTLGKLCQTDAECTVCAGVSGTCKVCSLSNVQCTSNANCPRPGETCGDAVVVTGSCKPTGAIFSYTGACQDVVISGEAGVCGDKVLNTGETCELSQTVPDAACTTKIVVNGVESTVTGHQRQICLDCHRTAPDPKNPQCVADAVCGNGRKDAGETCDDGVLNGSYGKCSRDCSGYGAFCGDNKLSPGEVCDKGTGNGAYAANASAALPPNGCSADCRSSAPYCGNGSVDVGYEQCELGDTQRTPKAICKYTGGSSSHVGGPCDTATDCTEGLAGETAVCGVATDPYTKSCAGVTDPAAPGRATQHTRTCNSSGSNACQYTGTQWSVCTAVGSCGDGIQDSGEQCDEGTGNGNARRCTLECKKNVCGDRNVYQGVEECDNGDDNGKATCSAAYGSSCLACSNQCKFLASAGGYCGDNIKNGPEQCDNVDGVYDPQTLCTSSNPAADCVNDGHGVYYARISCGTLGFDYGKASCNRNSCRFEGCQTCDAKVGNGTISAQVFDSVYSNQPVPNARVTLLAKGVKIDQVLTDLNGNFTFNNLNEDATCATYKIVVDSYDDNPCTNARARGAVESGKCADQPWSRELGTIDESQNNGYWPFTSQTFSGNETSLKTDGIRDADGKIYITPRSGPYQTTAVVRWKGELASFIDIHLYLPKGLAFNSDKSYACSVSGQPCNPASSICTGGGNTCERSKDVYSACTGTNCMRDIYFADGNHPQHGQPDLIKRPYANLFCQTQGSVGCTSFETAPETVKFTRKYATTGHYSLYLDDYGNYYTSRSADKNYKAIGLSVEVSTDKEVVVFDPVNEAGVAQCAKAWNVFNQEVATGNIDKPAKSWLGVRGLPLDLMVGSSACKAAGVWCDGTNTSLPHEQYDSCDQPATGNGDYDHDGILNKDDMCGYQVDNDFGGDGCTDVGSSNNATYATCNACRAGTGDRLCRSLADVPASGSADWNYDTLDWNKAQVGCPHPDSDNDGRWDGIDQCPTLSRWNGCTTRSGGVFSTDCEAKAPLTNEPTGCPNNDYDGDGIENSFDKCPRRPGTGVNSGSSGNGSNGCPITMDPHTLLGQRVACPARQDEKKREPSCCSENAASGGKHSGPGCNQLDKCEYNILPLRNPTYSNYSWMVADNSNQRAWDVCFSMGRDPFTRGSYVYNGFTSIPYTPVPSGIGPGGYSGHSNLSSSKGPVEFEAATAGKNRQPQGTIQLPGWQNTNTNELDFVGQAGTATSPSGYGDTWWINEANISWVTFRHDAKNEHDDYAQGLVAQCNIYGQGDPRVPAAGGRIVSYEPHKAVTNGTMPNEAVEAPCAAYEANIDKQLSPLPAGDGRRQYLERIMGYNPACNGNGGSCFLVSLKAWVNHFQPLQGWPTWGSETDHDLGTVKYTSFSEREQPPGGYAGTFEDTNAAADAVPARPTAECAYSPETFYCSDQAPANQCVAGTSNNGATLTVKRACMNPAGTTSFNVHTEMIKWCNETVNANKCHTSSWIYTDDTATSVLVQYRQEACDSIRQKMTASILRGDGVQSSLTLWSWGGRGFIGIGNPDPTGKYSNGGTLILDSRAHGTNEDEVCTQDAPTDQP